MVTPMDDEQPLIYPGPRMALMTRFGQLGLDDLRALETAVSDLARDRAQRGRVDRGFWFAWNDRLQLDRREQVEISELFADVLMAIASGLTGLDAARFGRLIGRGSGSRGLGGGLAGAFGFLKVRSQAEQHQEAAISLISDAAAPWDPRLGLMACWNVACAAALRRRLRPATVDTLEAPWRTVFGDPPA
jgi:hypothetical protein